MKSKMEQTIEQIMELLPSDVYWNVRQYLGHETAQLMMDAHKQDKLVLKYLRKYKVEEGDYKDDLYATMAPSVTGSNMYGDEDSTMKIFRSSISIGEKIRARSNALRNSLECGLWVSTVARTLTYDDEDEDGFIEFE